METKFDKAANKVLASTHKPAISPEQYPISKGSLEAISLRLIQQNCKKKKHKRGWSSM